VGISEGPQPSPASAGKRERGQSAVVANDENKHLHEICSIRPRWFRTPQRYSAQYVAQHGRPKQPEDLLGHACIRTRFGSGAMLDWEFEKAGRVMKVAPPPRMIATYLGLAMRAVHDGLGYWLTFEGYVRDAVRSGALVSVLEDWCAPFPGPFLYYPSRRQPPPALGAFVAFVAEWRKQERRRGKGA
jgi:DNA-binding transcriptional LysR family regulator